MRHALRCLLASFLSLNLLCAAGQAAELRIAAWNLEHLNDREGRGCLPRERADYEAIARQVSELDADIVAFQEVENEAAARRVFPSSRWRIEVSSRPPTGPGRPCWDRPKQRLGHLATGFALRRGIDYHRHRDLSALGGADASHRWGTDITIMRGGRALRLLSVHLETGCWGAGQDRDPRRKETCDFLRDQVRTLALWIDARQEAGEPFVILGDFNRRLAVPGDWAWAMISSSAPALELAAAGRRSRCDPRFPEFIDHLVLGGGAETMRKAGSFREAPRKGPHPDHCAVSALFSLERQR